MDQQQCGTHQLHAKRRDLQLTQHAAACDARRIIGIGQPESGTELQLVADTSLCVAAANNGRDVVQHPCNGSQFQLKDRGATGWEQQFTAGA